MIIHRMTFDIAVSDRDGDHDVNLLESALCRAMCEVPFVIGAEGVKNGCKFNTIDAGKAIERQVAEGTAIDLRPGLIGRITRANPML